MQSQATKQDPLTFSKMAGGGNDFVIIDNRSGRIEDAVALTRRICTPHLSVGADGLILIENTPRATFRMRYLNADGSPADFCANGTRCAARFAFVNVIAPKRMTIETGAGMVGAEVSDRGHVTLSLQPPHSFDAGRALQVGGAVIHGSSIIVGVPHYVVFLRDGLWSQDIVPLGRALRSAFYHCNPRGKLRPDWVETTISSYAGHSCDAHWAVRPDRVTHTRGSLREEHVSNWVSILLTISRPPPPCLSRPVRCPAKAWRFTNFNSAVEDKPQT